MFSLWKPGVTGDAPPKKEKVVGIPYFHRLSHNLKKIAQWVGATVVLSAPKKLSGLCTKKEMKVKKVSSYTKKHGTKFVDCVENVVYQIPLSCGRQHVGQTGRCLNGRLREHRSDVQNMYSKGMSAHCCDCKCMLLLKKCLVLKTHKNRLICEIIEAERIAIGRLQQEFHYYATAAAVHSGSCSDAAPAVPGPRVAVARVW